MTEIIGVRFKSGGKQYYFDPKGIQVEPGQGVIVETAKGIEYGECLKGNTMVEDEAVVAPLRPMLRVATEEDERTVARNREKEERAFHICQEKIAEHKLDMKLVDVEVFFDRSKLIFYFTAPSRIDFRDLVKDLVREYRARIELRQIGVRDEAKMLGGLGICGRPYCCKQFLNDFQPVSIKMAKEQGLSLNPTKISGACGRLMCCLKYEQDIYEELLKVTPKQGAIVKTPEGTGSVEYVSLLKGLVKVKLDDENEKTLKEFNVADVKVLKKGKNNEPSEEEIGE